MKLTSFKIRSRLLFMLVLATVLLVVMRVESGMRTIWMEREIGSLFDNRIVAIQKLTEAQTDFRRALVDIHQEVHSKGLPPATGAEHVIAALKAADAAWVNYETRVDTPQESAKVALARPVVDRCRQTAAQMADLLRRGELAELDKSVVGGAILDMSQLEQHVGELIDVNVEASRADVSTMRDTILTRMLLSNSLALTGLLTFWVIGYSVNRSIAMSLKRVTGEMDALGAGEGSLGARLKADDEDEIGDLARSFNRLMEKLQFLIRGIQESGIKVASSSTELAASSKQHEATVAQQVASTNEVESAARQIAHTAQQLSGTMGQVGEAAQQAQEVAATGQENLSHMAATMAGMQTSAAGIADKLATINTKAASITNIVTTINKVADQTNLLSLNASIEAAKAGEFGQGFGVVAREIRRLADQTAVATLDIEQTVKEMQVAVSSGVMSMDRFIEEVRRAVADVTAVGAQLGQIIDHVNQLGPQFMAVGEGMASQSLGAQQISEAMSQLSQAAGQTADSLRDSAQAIAQLNEAARDLQREVSRFGAS